MDDFTNKVLGLDVWKGYGSFFSSKENTGSGGKFELHFGSDIVDFPADDFRQTGDVQKTLSYTIEHQSELLDEIMAAVREEYDAALKDRDAFDPAIVDSILPPINNINELKALISPRTINIFQTSKDGYHYVGYELKCSWDDEHGLGILTHKSKVVNHGGAEVALTEWIAEEAAGISS